MKAKFTVKGVDKVTKDFRNLAKQDKFDELTDKYMRRIQVTAHSYAPEKTGNLKRNLISKNNVKKEDKGIRVLIDGTDYTLVQEYTNPRLPAFIRKSIWEHGPEYRREVEALAKTKKGRDFRV